MKISTDFLTKTRIKKMENMKFSKEFPNIIISKFLKDNEEYISICKAIEDYTTSAKNLAYIIVYHKIWSNTTFTPERIHELFSDVFNIISGITEDDNEIYILAKEDNDFITMSEVINKYNSFDITKHITIKDLSLTTTFKDVYLDAYNFFNTKLEELVNGLPEEYNNYITKLSENETPLSEKDFIYAYQINASELINLYYNSKQ